MKRVTLIAAACVLAVVAVLSVQVAAQDTNTQERTFLTFSAPVEMPGVTLQAGTYVFRLADTPSRNVVQVLTQDEKEILGQWTFVQAERPEVTGENVVLFKEMREGMTPAVQFWYYPGERIGKEFIYPKEQAMAIATRTGAEVMSDSGRISSNSTVTSTDAQGNVTPWPREGAATIPPAGDAQVEPGAEASARVEPAEDPAVKENASAAAADSVTVDSTLREAPAPAQPTAAAGSLTGNRGVATRELGADDQPQAVGTSGRADDIQARADAQVNDAGNTQARARELPRTASPLALSGLIGLLSLAGALGVRAARK